MPNNPGHIYLIDDEVSIRTSLTRMLELMGYTVESYPGPTMFLQQSMPIAPAVILLDMRLPDMSGLALQAKMAELEWTTPIIFMSGESKTQEAIDGMKAGAIDFLLKPFNIDHLMRAIQGAMLRDRQQFAHYRSVANVQQRFESLTPREHEVCDMVVDGKINKEIAEHFGSSIKTIKVHRGRVMEKMAAGSLLELAQMIKALRELSGS